MGRFSGKDILGRSKAFAVRVLRLVRTLPKDAVGRHLADQLFRSATSVGANLHEADMADTLKDFCHKVNIAQKEAGESVYWIDLIRDSKILPSSRLSEIQQEAEEIRKICRQVVFSTRQKAKT